ncbi:hypothetical protein LIV57_09320 [Chryseobacterium sp. X308]|uniref:hypothetical protein n=1 Tax=Chryseobacterium sp. X308 TaxID=2884873 RepID=UPI001D14FFE9|nr:hypothetical protein [Chryseobacterium sp. X308]MCC3215457.1 hypothetical protein [Chryseobacterium sp. X308]
MIKRLFLTLFLIVAFSADAQIGILTSTPQRTLHVNGSLQLVKELNVGGSENVQGTAGKEGEFLSSNGAGTSPTWRTIESQSFLKIVFTGQKTNVSPGTGSYTGSSSAPDYETPSKNYIYNIVNKIDNNYISYDANTGIFTVSRAGYYNISTYISYNLSLNGTNQTEGTAISALVRSSDTSDYISAMSTGHGERTESIYHQLTGIKFLNSGETFSLKCVYTQNFRLTSGNISISYLLP